LIVFRCADRFGREVVLYERAIARAQRIRIDATHRDRRCYYRRGVLPAPYDKDYLKVVVRFAPPDARGVVRGEVVTAYATPRLKRGETREW
jgi:hypothetical protein